MTEHHVPPFVDITQREFEVLRAQATGRRWMDVQFSASGMRLENSVVNHWVFPILANMRGLND